MPGIDIVTDPDMREVRGRFMPAAATKIIIIIILLIYSITSTNVFPKPCPYPYYDSLFLRALHRLPVVLELALFLVYYSTSFQASIGAFG